MPACEQTALQIVLGTWAPIVIAFGAAYKLWTDSQCAEINRLRTERTEARDDKKAADSKYADMREQRDWLLAENMRLKAERGRNA